MDDGPVDDVVRVSVERSGGFAGLVLRARVDTTTLPPDEARELVALAGQVDFTDAPPAPTEPQGPGADRFLYRVHVETAQSVHDVHLPETDVPADLKDLVAWVMAHRPR